MSPTETLQRVSSPYLIYDHRYSHPIVLKSPTAWRADMSGAVYAQFVTPFEILAQGLSGYYPRAHLRLPRDPHYKAPHPDRTGRGWIVVRAKAGAELFRADVNLFMDGGIGIAIEDTVKVTEALIEFGARHGQTRWPRAGGVDAPPEDTSVVVIEAVLERLEALHSPWGVINMTSSLTGVECFHESVQGQRTPERFVVDLRLTRSSALNTHY